MEDTLSSLRSQLKDAKEKVSNLEAKIAMLECGGEDKPDVPIQAGLKMRVLDLSRVLAGPYCSSLLSDMGADVIKLEMPKKGDDSRQFPPFHEGSGTSLYFVNLNRGKRSITLNLKSERGKEIFLDLARQSDVILENFSPGTMSRLGLGYEDIKKVNSKIIYASISGFGQTGPYKSRPGYDIISQAMSGLMSITGWPDSPPTRAGTAVGDIMAALFTCVGVLSAFHVRQETGHGQHIDVALVDSLFASMGQHLQKIFGEDAVPTRIGNRYEFIYPYDSFRAKDGWLIIAIANDALWKRFSLAIAENEEDEELKSLGSDDRFKSNRDRLEHHAQLRALVEKWTMANSKEYILHILVAHRIPACPIMGLDEVARSEHVAHAREMVVDVEQPDVGVVKLLGCPVKMSLTKPKPSRPAPHLGQHTSEVFQEMLGLSNKDVDILRSEDII